jgi:hypothetical protein
MENENWPPPFSSLASSALSPLLSSPSSVSSTSSAKDNPTPNKPYDGWNVCEKGYNATAALMGYNMLKDTKEPFQIFVEEKDDLTFMSIYFAGCDKVLR